MTEEEKIFNDLVSVLEKLPGLGPKSARRMVLHLIKHKRELLLPMIDSLSHMAQNIQQCQHCYGWDTKSPCQICSDPYRDRETLCVVADIIDMWAIERTKSFKGIYHILGGVLSAMGGYSPRYLKFDQLFERFSDEKFHEVIIALNPTIDGQTTMVYLMNELKQYPVKITTLAHGIPIGGELDYVDNGTIALAFSKRWEAA